MHKVMIQLEEESDARLKSEKKKLRAATSAYQGASSEAARSKDRLAALFEKISPEVERALVRQDPKLQEELVEGARLLRQQPREPATGLTSAQILSLQDQGFGR